MSSNIPRNEVTTETITVRSNKRQSSTNISSQAKKYRWDEMLTPSLSSSDEILSSGEGNDADAHRDVPSVDTPRTTLNLPRQEEKKYVRYEMFYML